MERGYVRRTNRSGTICTRIESFESLSENSVLGGTGHWPVAAGYQPAVLLRQVAAENGLVARSTHFQTSTDNPEASFAANVLRGGASPHTRAPRAQLAAVSSLEYIKHLD